MHSERISPPLPPRNRAATGSPWVGPGKLGSGDDGVDAGAVYAGCCTGGGGHLGRHRPRTDPTVAPPLLQRMVVAGRRGRKSGSGFYTYA